jgi:amidase
MSISLPEYVRWDATKMAELIEAREVSPLELVDAAITLAERVNPQLNAIVTPLFDGARARARTLLSAPFYGVPMFVKDLLCELEGVPSMAGSRSLRGNVPRATAELALRYERAGLVLLGRTTVPEFGLIPVTESLGHGATRNPWNTEHSAGGSSGGSAALVAARVVPIAHGNDGGGSLRIPAAACGLYGLKPTRGRNPLGPDRGDSPEGLLVEHVLTRSVRDSAAVLDATHGADIGSASIAPGPEEPFLNAVSRGWRFRRIAFTTGSLLGGAIHEAGRNAVLHAAEVLEESGHDVEEFHLQFDAEAFMRDFTVLWSVGAASAVESITEGAPGVPLDALFDPSTLLIRNIGKSFEAVHLHAALDRLRRTARQIARQLDAYDILLTPMLAEDPPRIGAFLAGLDPERTLLKGFHLTPNTPLWNVCGNPAASLPWGFSPAGLPLGIQIVGRFGDEATVLEVSAQLEAANPFGEKLPGVLEKAL